MTVIEASSVRVSTMADGTLRVVADVEPRFARDAFALFGAPGTPVALAALKPAEPEPAKPKGGEIAKWLGIRCGERAFQIWIARQFPGEWSGSDDATPAERAATIARGVCLVNSRAEIDSDKYAAIRFHTLIREPYAKHMGEQ